VFRQCVREDAAERGLALRDPVHGAREGVEEVVIQALERLLDAIVLEVVLSQQLHPGAVIGSQPLPASVAFPNRGGGGAAGEPPGFRAVHDSATGTGGDPMRRVAAQHPPDVTRWDDSVW